MPAGGAVINTSSIQADGSTTRNGESGMRDGQAGGQGGF
jgi:hypothetical protein